MKNVNVNAYVEIFLRDGTKEKIVLNLPKDKVEAGCYDYAEVQIFSGRETIRAGWLSEIEEMAPTNDSPVSQYTTVEGHPIVRDGEYETRSGEKATVLGFIPPYEDTGKAIAKGERMVGYVEYYGSRVWQHFGSRYETGVSSHDLMRPWQEKLPKEIYKDFKMGDPFKEGRKEHYAHKTEDGHTFPHEEPEEFIPDDYLYKCDGCHATGGILVKSSNVSAMFRPVVTAEPKSEEPEKPSEAELLKYSEEPLIPDKKPLPNEEAREAIREVMAGNKKKQTFVQFLEGIVGEDRLDDDFSITWVIFRLSEYLEGSDDR